MTTRKDQVAVRWGAAAILGIALLLAAAPAQAVTLIGSCPFTISAPGNYQLTTNLVCPAGDGIKITVATPPGGGSSGGVTLKLNGFRITAGSAASGVAIHVGAPSAMTDHVVISGPGLITNDPLNAFKFQTGIEMDNADFSQISQVTVVGSANTGIRGSGCTFLTVASNIVGRTSGPNPGDGIGLALSLSGSSTITGNDTSGNAVGIDLDSQHSIGDPNPTTLSNNIANGNSQDGIHLTNFHPSGVRISGNVTNGNGNSGIHVGGGASPTLVFSNTSAAANGTSDLVDDNFPVVVGGPGCLGDVWSGNVFFTRNQPCIN